MEHEQRIAIGQYLFIEGTHYEELKDKAIKFENHLSIFLHGPYATIHYREKFEKLKEFKSKPTDFMKNFLKNIKVDLNNFATDLIYKPILREVRDIYGLCTLSYKWGERHGFDTYLFTDDPDIVRVHDETIIGVPKFEELSLFQPLSIFHHTKESFVKEFGKIA